LTEKVVCPYNAEISAGSLMLRESREIAKLLLKGADDKVWHQAICIDNVLQKKVPATARRMARLIRNRLELMTPDLWKMVIDGTSEIAIQSLLAAAIKHSHLLGDFLIMVAKEHYKVFNKKLSARDWINFLKACEQKDHAVLRWSETTKAKLGQVIFRVLAEAKYVDSTRALNLTPISLAPEVKGYLVKYKESYIIKCMDISHE